MWRWADVKMRRCEVKMWRCKDEKMQRCEDAKMWGCEDVMMWRCEDEKMWRLEDVKMIRCEDEQMWRCEDEKMWSSEDVKIRRWEDVKMSRCEDEKMWRCENFEQTPTSRRTLRSDAWGKFSKRLKRVSGCLVAVAMLLSSLAGNKLFSLRKDIFRILLDQERRAPPWFVRQRYEPSNSSNLHQRGK